MSVRVCRLFAERDNILFLFESPVVPSKVFVQVIHNFVLKLIFHNISNFSQKFFKLDMDLYSFFIDVRTEEGI